MYGTAITASFAPRRMIEPLPNCFSIWPTAISMALRRSRSFRSSLAAIEAPDCRMGDFVAGACILEVLPERCQAKPSMNVSVASYETGTCRHVGLSPGLQKCADSAAAAGPQNHDFCSVAEAHDRLGPVPSPVGHALAGIAAGWHLV